MARDNQTSDRVLDYCSEPRTLAQIMEACGSKPRTKTAVYNLLHQGKSGRKLVRVRAADDGPDLFVTHGCRASVREPVVERSRDFEGLGWHVGRELASVWGQAQKAAAARTPGAAQHTIFSEGAAA